MLTDIRQHYYYFKSMSKNVLIAVFEDSHFDSTFSKCRIFAVTVTSRVTAGQQENLCAQVHGPTEPVKLLVSLEMSSSSTVILEESVKEDFYRCVNFQVGLHTLHTDCSHMVKYDVTLFQGTPKNALTTF